MSELDHILLNLFLDRENCDQVSKITVKDILRKLAEEHSDFKGDFNRIREKEYEDEKKTKGNTSKKDDPQLIKRVLRECLLCSEKYKDDDKEVIRELYVESVWEYVFDGEQKNRNFIRIKKVSAEEFGILVQGLVSKSNLPLNLNIFKQRSTTVKKDKNTLKPNQVKKSKRKSKKLESTQMKNLPKETPKDKMNKGRPIAGGIHDTTRSALIKKVGIPVKSFKDRKNRRMREILSLTTQIVNNDPTVREQVLANLNSDNKVEQNGSINGKEATERMKQFMGQVVCMVRDCKSPVATVSQDCSSNSTRSTSNSSDSIRSESTINVSPTSAGSLRMVLDNRNSVASEMGTGLLSNNQDCFSNSTASNSNSSNSTTSDSTIDENTTDVWTDIYPGAYIEIGGELSADDLMVFMEEDDTSTVTSMEEHFDGLTKLSPKDVADMFKYHCNEFGK